MGLSKERSGISQPSQQCLVEERHGIEEVLSTLAEHKGRQLWGGGPGGQQDVHEPAMPLWPKRPLESWGTLRIVWPTDQGK